ncbi:MAG: D-tyrosyl-tRNA(Tyr) deacylase [Clostridiales bacterium]|nr:D-tyrosyl-tRNA(Tyr) deacylase [Clostridiales bacterium]
MKVLVQRVKEAKVEVAKKVIGKIDKGYMLLVSFTQSDTKEIIDKMVRKVLNLRIMDDDNGVMNLAIDPSKDKILSISQFTLYADTSKGNRPSYLKALRGEESSLLYDYFNQELRKYIEVETGKFGADMDVSLINNGPCTIMLEL